MFFLMCIAAYAQSLGDFAKEEQKRRDSISVDQITTTESTQAPASTESGESKITFIDEKKEISPRMEWNREVVLRTGGTFTFQVTSQGAFSVMVITEKAYNAMLQHDMEGVDKEDVLFFQDSKELTLKKSITVPMGSSWFVIENRTYKTVEFHFQCFLP